ncbi:SAM-dependent methyltransferase [Emticicia oligotrophica DSM 17448]|uniref:SAM-dependent methyltransferase n=1 Tax=Emticicia oligotrophica (strain DSM 17448 / CIP 109782 / MTCC 6937 / GPTSA100-15) TaxID=929562 RepID=A0ABN4AP32_EMTOG|nr:methyltransferase domain-containing protein [Emticicia oligotrophica]AFK04099.1 SAM-dependent methyltransferase [Emticicia oligotrophica DSM 17448]
MNFKTRSYESELLDNEHIPQEDLYQNLKELDFINRYLGGHSVIIDGFNNSIFSNNIDNSIFSNYTENINLYEIGSGGGDNLRAVAKFLSKKKINVKLCGIDLKADCINFAQKFNSTNINYEQSDYQASTFPIGKPHIIFNSLFCHHFTDEQLIEMFRWMHTHAQSGFIIADLHRHPLAYYSIKILTKLFSKSYLVKNDAPLSVLRGFRKHELVHLLEQAGIKNYQIRWKWAFRWLIIVKK